MKIEYTYSGSSEDFRGAIQAILSMPPSVRHEFYKSEQGQKILKGIELVAENDKSPEEGLGDKREWDREEIEEMVKKIQDASPEQREIIFAILPGPVIGIVMNRLNSLAGMTPEAFAKTEGEIPPGMEKGVRGPVKGTAGYFQWRQRLAATRAARASISDAAKTKPGAPPPARMKKLKPKPEAEESSSDEDKESKYKKFVKKGKKA